MPFQALQQLSSRTPITRTTNTPQLDVVARATDPFVQQGRQGQDVLAALSSINPAIAAYGAAQEANKPDNVKQAVADNLQNRLIKNSMDTSGMNMENDQEFYNRPNGIFNLGAGYDAAYYTADGEARVGEWSQKWQEILKEKDNFRDSQNPQADYDAAAKEHYEHTFQNVADNPHIMAAVAPLYRATMAKTDADFLLTQNDQMKRSFMGNIGKTQTLDLRTAVDNPSFNPVAIRRMMDNDYFHKVKDNKMGLTIDRNAYNTAVIDNTNKVALDLMNDPTLSTSDALAKATKVLSVLKATGVDSVGNPDIALTDVRDAEGKSTFRELLHNGEVLVHSQYAARHTADHEALQLQNKAIEEKFTLDRVYNQDVPMSQLTKELRLLPAGVNVSELHDRALRFRDKAEYIDQDNTKLTDLKYAIETIQSIPKLRALQDTVHRGVGNYIKPDDAATHLQRITSRIDELKSEAARTAAQGLSAKSLQATFLSQAREDVKSTYAPLISKAREMDSGSSSVLALTQEMNQKLGQILTVYAAGGDVMTKAAQITRDATAGRIKATDLDKPRPEYKRLDDNQLQAEAVAGRISHDVFTGELRARIAEQEARLKKLQEGKGK
jgi:hypothetical protein